MKKADRRKLAALIRQHKMLSSIVAIPAVLYFPPEVVEQLNELCRLRQLSPKQLITEAFKSQETRFDQFVEEVMTPLAPGESQAWPEDPLYCLACVMMLHFVRTFIKMMEDPVGFEQMKKDAPAEWSFGSIEELGADDQADWWKADESE
jgi:hypothetical protein